MLAPLKAVAHLRCWKIFSQAAIIALTLSSLSACSWFQFPGVYRLEIQQGNILTQEMVDQLEVGMTKRQVNFVLGTPLIQDSFNLDRWDYYYSLSNSKGDLTRRKFTVYFNDDTLHRVQGDYQLNAPALPPLRDSPQLDPDLLNDSLDDTLTKRGVDAATIEDESSQL
jgi:outer membrane protein assembly factor BamE